MLTLETQEDAVETDSDLGPGKMIDRLVRRTREQSEALVDLLGDPGACDDAKDDAEAAKIAADRLDKTTTSVLKEFLSVSA